MRGLVVGGNLQAAIAIGQTPQTDGSHTIVLVSLSQQPSRPWRGSSEGAAALSYQLSTEFDCLKRIRRSCHNCEHRILKVGRLNLDHLSGIVRRCGKRIELTPYLSRLLACLMERPGRACSREELLEKALRYDNDPGTNVLEVHVNRLRSELKRVGATDVIKTARLEGYLIEEERMKDEG